jgi:GNAT superfamily N-acetyltransferase
VKPAWALQTATLAHAPEIEALIPRSVFALQAAYYSPAQMSAALGPVFGVDRQIIRDGTYFVAVHGEQVVACGGWSRRAAVFGGDRHQVADEGWLDPAVNPARIRAFFVAPDWARQGIGTALLEASETAAIAAGFRRAVLVATLAGEPLYARYGYAVEERYAVPLTGDLTLPVVRMSKALA